LFIRGILIVSLGLGSMILVVIIFYLFFVRLFSWLCLFLLIRYFCDLLLRIGKVVVMILVIFQKCISSFMFFITFFIPLCSYRYISPTEFSIFVIMHT